MRVRRILVSAALFVCAVGAWAQPADPPYPQRLVTIIVPFSPGTGPDLLARMLGQNFTERANVPAVVDNKPGASGNIGTELAAKAPADGYTLMMTATTFALNPSLSKAARYDPLTSFTPVVLVATGDLAFAVTASSPAKTLQDLIDRAKAQPGAIYYASSGNGTPQHLSMELFKLRTGIDLTHVPYKDSAGAMKDLAGGHVEAMAIPVHTVVPLVTRGHVRVLGVFGKQRSAVFPEAPTLREAGAQEVDAQVWFGVLAPPATPAAIVRAINAEINAILALPATREALTKQGLAAAGGPPERFAELIRAELARWKDVVVRAKIRAD